VRTIALEEHFWTAELAAPPGTGQLAVWGPHIGDQLRDLGSLRLADMDAHGIDLQVISHVAPAAQGHAGAEGLARAREANDQLAAAVRTYPGRFAGFATLPTADPHAAADELERATAELGFVRGSNRSWTGSSGSTYRCTCTRHRRRRPCARSSTAGCRRPWRPGWPPAPGAGTPRPACTCCG
jgi:predicted TIM-barrel fold metal-dependent hydrolase